MTRDHSLIEELMAIDALGGLDGDDRATLERERAGHGADCAECLRLERAFTETAGRLAFALDPEPVDEGMVERILASHRTETVASGVAATPAASPAAAVDELAERRSRRPKAWQALVAAAAVIALLVVVVATAVPTTTGVSEAARPNASSPSPATPRARSRWRSHRASPAPCSGEAGCPTRARHGVRDLDDRGRPAGLGRMRHAHRRGRRDPGRRRHRHDRHDGGHRRVRRLSRSADVGSGLARRPHHGRLSPPKGPPAGRRDRSRTYRNLNHGLPGALNGPP